MDAYAGVGPSCHSITLPMDSCVFIFEMVIDVYVDKRKTRKIFIANISRVYICNTFILISFLNHANCKCYVIILG